MAIALGEHVRRFAPLSELEEQHLLQRARERSVAKRAILAESGHIPGEMFYVREGVLRLVGHSDNGQEHTLQFALEGWWLSDLDCFVRRAPSDFSVQAVEKSVIHVLRREDYEGLFDSIAGLERYFRLVYQRGFAAATRRLHLFESTSATERYQNFARAYPEFVERVPGYMLASFLGFSPEFLSKIRAKKT